MKHITLVCGAISLFAMATFVPTPTCGQNPPQNNAPATNIPAGGDVSAFIRNAHFHLTDRIIVDIVTLSGKLTPKLGQMVVFDDKQSFAIDVDSANVRLSTTSLTNDLNDFVFAAHDAPLKKLSASIDGDHLSVKGLLASKGDIPFETTAMLTVTPEGMIRVHTTSVKALHLQVKGLMDVLGLDTAKLVDTKKVEGVSVDKDDLILDPQVILPPPRVRGHLNNIKIENGEIALTFGPQSGKENRRPLKNNCGARNYLQFEGGAVRFGKLTMVETDLTLVDADPADPFDFAIDHYKEQLVAGNTKMTPQGGLCAHVPDYDKIKRRTSPAK